MSMIRAVLISASILLLASCSSIINGSSQKVQVVTAPPSSATCSIMNSQGTSSILASSQTMVKRSKSDLNINCADARGLKGARTVESELEPWFIGNILIPFGIIIGTGIDFGTGSAWGYPAEVTVPLK